VEGTTIAPKASSASFKGEKQQPKMAMADSQTGPSGSLQTPGRVADSRESPDSRTSCGLPGVSRLPDRIEHLAAAAAAATMPCAAVQATGCQSNCRDTCGEDPAGDARSVGRQVATPPLQQRRGTRSPVIDKCRDWAGIADEIGDESLAEAVAIPQVPQWPILAGGKPQEGAQSAAVDAKQAIHEEKVIHALPRPPEDAQLMAEAEKTIEAIDELGSHDILQMLSQMSPGGRQSPDALRLALESLGRVAAKPAGRLHDPG
jgi:hypothetical protein